MEYGRMGKLLLTLSVPTEYIEKHYNFSGSTKANLVIKIMPNNIGRRKTFRSFDFFRNELNFYNKVWKKFQEFQAEKTDLQNPFVDIPK